MYIRRTEAPGIISDRWTHWYDSTTFDTLDDAKKVIKSSPAFFRGYWIEQVEIL